MPEERVARCVYACDHGELFLGDRGDRASGSLDQADNDRVRGAAGAHCGTVSYLHMHRLVALLGQPAWVAALTPLSVDGMIVAASTTLLADRRLAGGAERCRGRC